jgi:hypothetical protein
MGIGRKSCLLVLALLAFGAARLPFEAGLSKDLRDANLFPRRLEIGTRDRIGQTSSAVALGGLRTLVATFLNLRAFTFFTERKWADVAKTFGLIVDLAPRTRYYWETGSWHQAYNAASYYLNDSELPPLRRKEAWRSSIHAGRAFLERGVRNCPDDWNLHANLGFLLSDSNKFAAFRDADETFAAAAEAYRKSAETGKALGYVRRARFYALARVTGREAEALALGRSLHAEDRRNHTPTLLVLLLVLEAWENPEMDTAARAVGMFGTPEKAHDTLAGHWMRTRERFPVHGVAKAIEALERQLKIPPEKSAFSQPPPPMMDPDDMFRSR